MATRSPIIARSFGWLTHPVAGLQENANGVTKFFFAVGLLIFLIASAIFLVGFAFWSDVVIYFRAFHQFVEHAM